MKDSKILMKNLIKWSKEEQKTVVYIKGYEFAFYVDDILHPSDSGHNPSANYWFKGYVYDFMYNIDENPIHVARRIEEESVALEIEVNSSESFILVNVK